MSNDLHFQTIAQTGRLIQAKKLSPLEYVDHLIARIESLDHQLNTFITPTFEHARQQAKNAEREVMAGRYLGPMHGIPFGAKDIYETAGILTTGGSRIGQQHVPDRDCAVIAQLYQAGALLMGKLNTHEFAHGGPSLDLPWPPVRNPWDVERFSGGSSSGSGAAVAAGFVGVALGTDTGGSIRGPASLCGIAGFMPSSGLVSRVGVMPNSFTLDHCGPMAWTVEDCALMLQAMAGVDAGDGNSFEQPIPNFANSLGRDLKGLRVGVLRYVWEEDLVATPEHQQGLNHAVDIFEQLGACVQDCRLRPMQDYMDVKVVIAETEIFSVQQQGLSERPHDYGRDFLTRILPAVMFQSLDFLAASREHKRMLDEMTPVYAQFDVLLMPGFGPAPLISAHQPISFWRKPNAQVLANITGGPALSVNCGFSTSGLPMGLQIVGAPLADALVLKTGHAFEQALGNQSRRPALSPGKVSPPLHAPQCKPDTSLCDAQTRVFAERLAVNAGLTLDDALLDILYEAAPHALDMSRRLRRHRNWFDAPANVFLSGQSVQLRQR